MESPAQRSLIDRLAAILVTQAEATAVPRILNIGAAHSTLIEEGLIAAGARFCADRIDVEDCSASGRFVGTCYRGSVENMSALASGAYDAAFANYVLEHVSDISAAAREIKRVLKPGAPFVLSTPNPRAPEFIFSRLTPLWFHQLFRGNSQVEGERAYETTYAYRSIDDLVARFSEAGFLAPEIRYFPVTAVYLSRIPFISRLSRIYDRCCAALGWKSLLGNVCLVFNS